MDKARVTMRTEVKIAQFKSRLSQYLKAVRRGNEIIVKDRDEPIARVIPYKPPVQTLITIPPTRSLKDIDKIPVIRPKNLKPGDLEEALRWTKRERF